MRSVDLRKEPSVRQVRAILQNIERELTALGAFVDQRSEIGGLRFRMPWPWKAPRLGILLAVTSGRAVVSAGSGGPWRVRYGLSFSVLRWIMVLISVGLVAIGLGWPRSSLINALLAVWVIGYGIPYVAASTRFRRIVQVSAADVVERRRAARDSGPQPAITDPPASGDSPPGEMGVRPAE
jgi:hypothetical protein